MAKVLFALPPPPQLSQAARGVLKKTKLTHLIPASKSLDAVVPCYDKVLSDGLVSFPRC